MLHISTLPGALTLRPMRMMARTPLILLVGALVCGIFFLTTTKNISTKVGSLVDALEKFPLTAGLNVNAALKEAKTFSALVEIMEDKLPGSDSRVVEVVKESLVPPSPHRYNLRTDPAYLQGSATLLPYIQKLFHVEREGFFVEAGALDGQFLSNSLWLEQFLGWRGLLAEPAPDNYKVLRTKNRNCWVSNSCLSRENYTTKITLVTTKVPGDKLDNLGMAIRGGAHEVNITQDIYSQAFFKKNKALMIPTTVHCFPLLSYLLALNVTKVDFLSLDTQGSELGILRTLPWDGTLTIRVIVAEVVVESYGRKIEEFMVGKGYVVLSRGFDYWFARKGDPVIARA